MSAAPPMRATATRSPASSSTMPMVVVGQGSDLQPVEDVVAESPSKRTRHLDPADSSESGMG